MKPHIGIAAPTEVDALWPILRDGFTKAIRRSGNNDFSPGQLWQLCRSGGAFLIIAHDGERVLMASVWRFETHEGRHAFHCLSLFGAGMKTWFDIARAFVSGLARENGATRLTTKGRIGWLRACGAVTAGELYEVDI